MKVNNRHCSFYYKHDHEMGKVEIDKSTTALLIIDMQNYFCHRPEYDLNDPEQVELKEEWEQFYQILDDTVIPNNQKILERFRNEGMLVSHARIACQLKDGRDRSLSQKATGFNELLLPLGTEPAEIIDELKPIEDEIVVVKTTDSAVTGTNLRLLLRNCGIDTVVVTGVFTDQCVSGTVRALADESFKVWLIEDACRAGNEEIQNNELEILNNIYCHVINTEELMAAL
jgi:nicotinamidase-related amidase